MITVDGDYQIAHVVASPAGVVKMQGESFRKARLWVLEDHTGIVVVPGYEGKGVSRIMAGRVTSLIKNGSDYTATIEDDDRSIQVRESSCLCGFGEVGTAGPVDGRWRILRVRKPDWYEILR